LTFVSSSLSQTFYQTPCLQHLLLLPQTESSSTISSTSTTPSSLPHIQHLITIKLNRDNYLLWKAQIVPYLRGQHLYGFIDGTKPAPPPTLAVTASETTTVIPNPEFYTWHTQDQMILSALISSLSETSTCPCGQMHHIP
jgi:hypothetical protein